ncbi:hypothetical protein FIBSPDRAFT_551805 [Athelia psychrophila]|uniref:Uncharacterized protein n=1 Tax=Athelia psychrophila TaxID=1759441 RepID=A0A166UV39_9AGAM|nr:hypothetical protein FIBSPDRAFT_551805 [Fibularhizoctonia sp. CBS 109695]
MLTWQLHAYANATTADLRLHISPTASCANGAVLPTAPKAFHPASMLQRPASPSPSPVPAPESQFPWQPGLRRNPNYSHGIFIQEAASSPGASSAHSRRSLSRRFPSRISSTSLYSGARRCRSRPIIRTTATEIPTAWSPCSIRGDLMELHPRGRGTAPSLTRQSSAWGGGLRVTGHHLETAGLDVGRRAPTQRRSWIEIMPKGVEWEQQRRQRRTQGRGGGGGDE